MKKKVISIPALIFVFALITAACSTNKTPEAIPTVSLDASAELTQAVSSGTPSASAIVVPASKIELSFPLAGVVKTVEVTEGDAVNAGDVLVTLDTTILEAKVREAETVVVTEQTQVAYLIRTGVEYERLEAAQADVDRAQAGVDIAKAQLAQSVLVTPIGGTVTQVDIAPSEFAGAGQILVTIGDLSHFQIETTDLSEKDVTHVQIGQLATIFIEALNQEFPGKVVDIARYSQTIGGDVVYAVTVEFDQQPEGLRWGMSADVRIESE